jgi:hypothetical protein
MLVIFPNHSFLSTSSSRLGLKITPTLFIKGAVGVLLSLTPVATTERPPGSLTIPDPQMTDTIPTTVPLYKKHDKVLATKTGGTLSFGGEVVLVVTITGKPTTYVVSNGFFHESFEEQELKFL